MLWRYYRLVAGPAIQYKSLLAVVVRSGGRQLAHVLRLLVPRRLDVRQNNEDRELNNPDVRGVHYRALEREWEGKGSRQNENARNDIEV